FSSSFIVAQQVNSEEILAQSIHCPFQISGMYSSNNGKYMAVKGKRNCAGKVYQEITVYRSGESFNTIVCNVFFTENEQEILVKWIANKLHIHQNNLEKAFMKNTVTVDNVPVIYPKRTKTFY